MSIVYAIPTSSDNQTFNISLVGATYVINLYWNTINLTWIIDISDITNNQILTGIPVVANIDLLAPFGYLNFGGQLIAQTDHAIDVPPTFGNLGTDGHIYFVVQ